MNKYSTIGVDVSKMHLDVFFSPTGVSKSFSNTQAGIASFLKALSSFKEVLVILEPTGGYEKSLIQKLADKAIPFARINPYQMRSFARGLGNYAKTDKIDAKMLASYGSLNNPAPKKPLSDEEYLFQNLVNRQRQLIEMVRQEKCRLEKAEGYIKEEILEHLAYLQQRIAEKNDEIKALMQKLPKQQAIYKMLISEPGVGDQTAFTLLTYMPELGTLDGKKIAALAGVTPMPFESGKMKKEARIMGGRKNVRNLLYMAALVAARCNAKFKEIYHSLRAKGKKAKVALTAIMRRLLVILNAKARDIILKNNFT